MGLSFDAYLLDVSKIKEGVEKRIKRGELNRLEEILGEFGDLKDGKLLVQNVEYWQDYNSYYEVMNFIERYYGIEEGESYDVIKDSVLMTIGQGANVHDVAAELEIDLPEEEEE